jgi:DNA mismatch repair protein MutL
LCFERHATYTSQRIFSLNTKRFSWRSISPIAAIAHVDEEKQDQEEVQIIIEGSCCARSCCILKELFAVKNLFNIPARRNLKSDTVEYRHIIDEFHRVALAHPSIYFTFTTMVVKCLSASFST